MITLFWCKNFWKLCVILIICLPETFLRYHYLLCTPSIITHIFTSWGTGGKTSGSQTSVSIRISSKRYDRLWKYILGPNPQNLWSNWVWVRTKNLAISGSLQAVDPAGLRPCFTVTELHNWSRTLRWLVVFFKKCAYFLNSLGLGAVA